MKTSSREMERSHILMAEATMVNGRTIKCTEKELSQGKKSLLYFPF
jgi:hypothetical protein